MKAYKLFRKRKDGTLGPLFINRNQVVPLGVSLPAGDHPTKGFAHRQGWHCTLQPIAPHLSLTPKSGERRVWCEVEVEGTELYNRPESQGGTWVLAQTMTVIRELTE